MCYLICVTTILTLTLNLTLTLTLTLDDVLLDVCHNNTYKFSYRTLTTSLLLLRNRTINTLHLLLYLTLTLTVTVTVIVPLTLGICYFMQHGHNTYLCSIITLWELHLASTLHPVLSLWLLNSISFPLISLHFISPPIVLDSDYFVTPSGYRSHPKHSRRYTTRSWRCISKSVTF